MFHSKALIGISISAFCLLLPGSSWACKELVKFPEHLSKSALRYHSHFFVLKIIAVNESTFRGVIQVPLGPNQTVGQEVDGKFLTGEESHAVCPNVLKVGTIYLLHSNEFAPPLVVSRYNGLDVSEAHEKFSVYVEDLKAAYRDDPVVGTVRK